MLTRAQIQRLTQCDGIGAQAQERDYQTAVKPLASAMRI